MSFYAVSKNHCWWRVLTISDKLRKLNAERRAFSIHYFDVNGDEAVFMDCNCRHLGIDPCVVRHSPNLLDAIMTAPSQMHPMFANTWHLRTPSLGSLPTSFGSPWLPSTGMTTPKSCCFPRETRFIPPVNYAPHNSIGTVTPFDSGYCHSGRASSVSSGYSSYQESTRSLQSSMASTSLSGNSRAMYAMGNNGTPVNTTYGLVATEVTGIHIKGLSYSTSQSRMISYLTAMGCQSQSCKLNVDRDGRSRGSALAKYGSQSAAQSAVEILNGSVLDDRRMTVKLDVNRSAVSAGTGSRSTRSRPSQSRPPMVLDGSAGRRDPSS